MSEFSCIHGGGRLGSEIFLQKNWIASFEIMFEGVFMYCLEDFI